MPPRYMHWPEVLDLMHQHGHLVMMPFGFSSSGSSLQTRHGVHVKYIRFQTWEALHKRGFIQKAENQKPGLWFETVYELTDKGRLAAERRRGRAVAMEATTGNPGAA